MHILIILAVAWAVSAAVDYVVFRREHIDAIGKWTRIDRLLALSLAIASGPWGLCVITTVALLDKLNATHWAQSEAKW